MTTRTYTSTNDQWARRAHLLVSLSKTKPCQFSSVTSLCLHLKNAACILFCLHVIMQDDLQFLILLIILRTEISFLLVKLNSDFYFVP